jgi:hypothetical protein
MEQVREAPNNPDVFAEMPTNQVPARMLANYFLLSGGFYLHRRESLNFGPHQGFRGLTALGNLEPPRRLPAGGVQGRTDLCCGRMVLRADRAGAETRRL